MRVLVWRYWSGTRPVWANGIRYVRYKSGRCRYRNDTCMFTGWIRLHMTTPSNRTSFDLERKTLIHSATCSHALPDVPSVPVELAVCCPGDDDGVFLCYIFPGILKVTCQNVCPISAVMWQLTDNQAGNHQWCMNTICWATWANWAAGLRQLINLIVNRARTLLVHQSICTYILLL